MEPSCPPSSLLTGDPLFWKMLDYGIFSCVWVWLKSFEVRNIGITFTEVQSIVTLRAIGTEKIARNKLHGLRVGWGFVACLQGLREKEYFLGVSEMSNNSVLGMKSHFSVPNKYLIIAGGGISYPKKSSQIISLISFLSEMVIQFSWFCGRFEVSCLLLTGSLYVMKQKMILQCVTHHVQHKNIRTWLDANGY